MINIIQYGWYGDELMKIKKKILVIILLLCCFSMYSCNTTSIPFIADNGPSEYIPRDWGSDDYPFAKETMIEVLRCLDENDKETLKSLFSESVASGYDLDKQIEEAMIFYEGKSNSHDDVSNEIRRADFRKDHYAYKSIRTVIDNVITDNNKTYMIECVYILVDDKDETNIGLSKLFINDFYDPIGNYYLVGDDGDYPKS